MQIFAKIVLAASLSIGSLAAVSAPALAAPIARVDVGHPSDVIAVRDDWRWRRHHHWGHDRRYWHHGRGDWRRDHWRRDHWRRDHWRRDHWRHYGYWHHDRRWHHRPGVVIRF